MCGELRKENIGEKVVLNGWIQKRRNLGGLIFCDVRDKTGITQVVFNDQIPQSLPRWISKAMSEDHRKSKIFTKLYSVLMNSRLMKGLRR
jgi:aspartyl-tRNA synthetase